MSAILLAEDSPTHTALMRSILEDEGHDVECVNNGKEAADALDRSLPDLVVTDLRMPVMNGLELVETIVARFPHLPTVVATARGSESLAVDALALGAADFVPKNSLAKLLTRVVRQTIRLADCDRRFENLSGELLDPEFVFSLASDLRGIEPATEFLIQSLAAAGHMNPTQRIRTATAVSCALFNAICFGNLEIHDDPLISHLLAGDEAGAKELQNRAETQPYRGRMVTMKVSIGRNDARISVAHDGNGSVTRLTPAPGTPESFELEQCRGMMLMSSFMDEVFFRSSNSEVVMVKRY